ncbi:hypothetical protein J2046_001990 [Rhizobium petrolearium]|uniref:hypothetical protein n=1 Tax=Neorhizobium petrolearium TaxID=515361 RepID=UPI001FDCF01F|nr:hypothetical protein [Neorhizobium petrolearium]
MLLNWVKLWDRLKKENDRRGRHPLADPLEGAEWRGLLWIVPLLGRLAGSQPKRRAAKTRRILRREPISGWSRNSAG